MKWDRINKRRALVWGAWAVVLLIGLAGLFVWHSIRSYEAALREFEVHVGSANHQDYLRDPVPDDRNAALAFGTAASGIEIGSEWSRTPEPVAWSAATEAAVREVLGRNQAALDALQAATELPSCVWPSMLSVGADSLLLALRAARLLRLQGFVGVADADRDRIERSFGVLGDLAECLYAQPHLVGSLIAAAVERTQLEVVHAAVSSPGTSPGLLAHFRLALERSSRVDRVRWAVAAEGAFAFRLVEDSESGVLPLSGGPLRSVFAKRLVTALASRWVEFAAWSEEPFEELLSEPPAVRETGLSVAGLVADMTIASLRHAIVTLRTNGALADLALVAIQGQLYGRRHGSYDGAFDERAGVTVLNEGDGSAVLIDSKLGSLLRAYLISSAEGRTLDAESTLDLTVWRLPPPIAER